MALGARSRLLSGPSAPHALIPYALAIAVGVFVATAHAQTYTVQKGDTLYHVAQAHHVSVGDLQAANQLGAENIYPGQVLMIPTAASSPVDVDVTDVTDVVLLARVIQAEAAGEPFLGQVAVGAVILNRVKSPAFPDSIKAVVDQPGQFASVQNDRLPVLPNADALTAARTALLGVDPTGGALFFHNPDKPATEASKAFWRTRTILAVIGHHVFAR